jgi:hypothetical protein
MIIYDIRLHDESGVLFLCDCGCEEFRQVTDIEQGAQGYEVYECRDCQSWYRCVTIGEMHPAQAVSHA